MIFHNALISADLTVLKTVIIFQMAKASLVKVFINIWCEKTASAYILLYTQFLRQPDWPFCSTHTPILHVDILMLVLLK